MITTYNFDDVTDEQWIKLIGKPVMLGVYSLSDDRMIAKLAGELLAVSFSPEKTKIVTGGDGSGFFDPRLAYGLVTF